jgi:hypothetical protein
MFSKLISDYLEKKDFIQSFYSCQTNLDGVSKAIDARQQFATDRNLIHQVFAEQ